MTKQAGFTLIEILIVIFIVSIVALMTTLTIGNSRGGRVLVREVAQLQQLLKLVQETAMIEQIDLSVGMWQTGYAVWRYDVANKAWKLINNERGFKPRDLPGPLQLSLRMNNKTLLLPNKITTVREPQLWFSSSGDALPAEITMTSGDIKSTLTINNNGEVTLVEAK